jgi:hypothetical protein
MKSELIADAHHVVRYVKPTAIDADGLVNGSEFQLRSNRPDDVGVSVNWLEYFSNRSKSEQVSEVRRLVRLVTKRLGCFAELNIGRTRNYLAKELSTILFAKDPLESNVNYSADPSHALIVGLPAGNTPEAELIGDMIAECVINRYPAIID